MVDRSCRTFVVGRVPIVTETVIASSKDRDRLTDAITRASVECGYRTLDIEQVADYAGLTIDDFERQFTSKDQCLLAAFDSFLDRLYAQLDEDCEEALDWPGKVRATIESAFSLVAELEGTARLFVVDAIRTGEAGLERQRTSIDGAANLLRAGRLLYPAAADYPEEMERTLVAGVVMMASSRLLAEEADVLPDLAPEAVEMVLTPYLGSRAARLAAIS
jgi:AcrR family transcriptional regulator